MISCSSIGRYCHCYPGHLQCLHFPHKPRELIKIICFVSVCVCDKSFKSVKAPRVALLIHLSRFIGSSVCKVALSVLFTSRLPTK